MKDYDFSTLLQALSDEYSSAATGIGCGSWIGPIGAVEAELRRRCESSATLEAELAAEREAKEALAKTCVTLWTSGDFIRKADAWSEMMSNPIARAEVEKAGKAREA